MELLGLEPAELRRAEQGAALPDFEGSRDKLRYLRRRIKEGGYEADPLTKAGLQADWTVCRHYYARAAIIKIAEDTRQRLEMSESAPRVKKAKDDLRSAVSACETLVRILNDPLLTEMIEGKMPPYEWLYGPPEEPALEWPSPIRGDQPPKTEEEWEKRQVWTAPIWQELM